MIEFEDSNTPSKLTPDSGQGRLIRVGAGAVELDGILTIPENAHGLVILAHGIEEGLEEDRALPTHRSGIALTNIFNGLDLATFQVDLFNSEERRLNQETGFFRGNTEIMQQRLIGMADWFLEHPETQHFSIGYYGMNEAGAGALIAAAERPDAVAAVVVAGGRVNSARDYLPQVLAPVLFITAALDETAGKAQQDLLDLLKGEKSLEQVQGLDTLAEGSSVVEEVARLAGQWFTRWLVTIG